MRQHKHVVLGIILASAITIGGCAAIQKIWNREQTGLNKPMNVQGETPIQVAHRQLEPVKDLPYGNIAFAIGSILLAAGYGWVNGKHNQAGLATTPVPFTGSLGTALPPIEGLVQNVSTLSQGLLNPPVALKLSPAWDRFWKVGAAVLSIGIPAVIGSPAFASFIISHPQLATAIGVGLPTLLALERKLQEVLPPPPTV